MATEKEKAIAEAMKQLNKKHGQSTVMTMDDTNRISIQAVSTGCFALDRIFGCGGLPRGRIIELFGAESSGKSTLAMFLVAQIQKTGGKAVLVDAEFAFSSDYAEKIGVDVASLIVSQPSTGEEALDIVDKMAATHGIDIIVVDSVAALVPEKELEGEIGDVGMAQQARLMSKGMRVLAGNISKTNTVVIFINQVREKVGVFFGNKDVTPGGKALKFFASVRLEVKKGDKIKDKSDGVIGNWLKICGVKNKVGFPWKAAELEIIFEKGIDIEGAMLDSAVEFGYVEKNGSSYVYGETKLGVGRENARNFLIENPDVAQAINKKLYETDKEL